MLVLFFIPVELQRCPVVVRHEPERPADDLLFLRLHFGEDVVLAAYDHQGDQ